MALFVAETFEFCLFTYHYLELPTLEKAARKAGYS